MSDLTPAEAQRHLAAEFEREGWESDLVVGRSIVERAEQQEHVDAAGLARSIPGEFLDRYNATREDVASAIERALGGHSVRAVPEAPTKVVINNQTYPVNLAGAQITHSNVNIGPGTQINVDASARKDDVLAAVAAVVAAGLAGDWNPDAVRDLAAAVDARDDIDLEDIEQAAQQAVEAEQPKQGRVREMLNQIAASGAGGVLATGVVSALSAVFPHLPI